ncbi:MAG: hypothetical protein JST73_13400 [Actinobacteria bacterium]|nr:hypothetical protein [Actinomycetota bacterium]
MTSIPHATTRRRWDPWQALELRPVADAVTRKAAELRYVRTSMLNTLECAP